LDRQHRRARLSTLQAAHSRLGGVMYPSNRRTKKAKAKASRSTPPKHVPTKGLYGWITHTELASNDPLATKDWCAKVLGWTFRPSFQTPDGEYLLFAYSDQGGGGIRQTKPAEPPHSSLSVHVADATKAFE